MTVIRVNPQSVQAYGADASAKFQAIAAELTALVSASAEVHYFGPNAVDFKTRAAQLAADFANRLHQDIAAIAEAVRASTAAIATSLGGAGVSIVVDNRPVSVPAIASVDYVDVDTSALEALTGTVDRHFAMIDSLFDGHLQKLQTTDWTGNAREQAVASVQGFTTSAKAKSGEAHQNINRFINDQIQSVTSADR